MVKPMHLEFETTVPPPQMVRALRELISEVGWEKERTEGSRMVDRWAIIMPIATHARTLGLVIKSGPLTGMEMQCWSHTPGSAGEVHHMVFHFSNRHPIDRVHEFIQHWVVLLPRSPFKWTKGEKLILGFLLPLFRRSRKAFAAVGVPIEKNQWPQKELPDWSQWAPSINQSEEE